MNAQISRRAFVGAAGASLMVMQSYSSCAAPSERVRVAMIGVRPCFRSLRHIKVEWCAERLQQDLNMGALS
jgi:hypothetical protein